MKVWNDVLAKRKQKLHIGNILNSGDPLGIRAGKMFIFIKL